MMKLSIPWRNQTFIKLVATFLIVILPIYFIGFIVYHWAIKTLRDQVDNSMVAQSEFYLGGLDKEIQRIKLLQYEQINDESLNLLAFGPESLDDYSRSRAILTVQQQLLAIANSSRYINYACADIPVLEMTINSTHGVDALDTGAYESLNPAVVTPRSQLIQADGNLQLNMVYPFSVTPGASGRRSFDIRIVLANKEFVNAINQFCSSEGSFAMMFSSRLGVSFFSSETPQSIRDVSASLMEDGIHAKSMAYSKVINGRRYLVVCSASDYLGMALVRYTPENVVYKPVEEYQIWFWILSYVLLLIIAAFYLSTHRFIQKPLSVMVGAFKRVEGGDLKARIDRKQNDEFKYLYQRFNAMVENLDLLIDQVYKQKILTQNAELKQLQSQINPHFLYNTFFMLHSLAEAEDMESISYFLNHLGNYFQFITRSSNSDVPLCKEVEHARTYAEIQAMRFSNRIAADFEELPEEYADIAVPRLILQPIIENAFKYGLEDKAGDGMISVRFQKSGGLLHIVIQDNGNGLGEAAAEQIRRMLSNEYEGETTAIINIHRRLRLKFGAAAGLDIAKGEMGGLKIIINIVLPEDKDVQAADC